MTKTLDVRRRALEYLAERLGFKTLSSLDSYEATVLAILTYSNTIIERKETGEGKLIDPQLIIEYYLDYKLSVDRVARREIIELFKSAGIQPPPPSAPSMTIPQPEEEKKKRFKVI